MSLEALERSDLSRLPGGIFTRAFIRNYAQEVGLDPDRTIQDFIAELPPDSAAATAHHAEIEDGEGLESNRRAVAILVKLVLVSLPIAAFVIYYGMYRAPRTQPAAALATAVRQAGDMATAVPTATPALAAGAPVTPAPAATTPQPTGLVMEIAPKANCFVSVTVDGEQVFSGMMHAGDRRQVSARDEISLSVGDAGAFAFTLNGMEGRPLGAPGEVVSKRITLAESKDYVTP